MTANEIAYRDCWQTWLVCSTEEFKLELEVLMDELQEKIATRPTDPRWVWFADQLPGYREFWGNFEESVEEFLQSFDIDV